MEYKNDKYNKVVDALSSVKYGVCSFTSTMVPTWIFEVVYMTSARYLYLFYRTTPAPYTSTNGVLGYKRKKILMNLAIT